MLYWINDTATYIETVTPLWKQLLYKFFKLFILKKHNCNIFSFICESPESFKVTSDQITYYPVSIYLFTKHKMLLLESHLKYASIKTFYITFKFSIIYFYILRMYFYSMIKLPISSSHIYFLGFTKFFLWFTIWWFHPISARRVL